MTIYCDIFPLNCDTFLLFRTCFCAVNIHSIFLPSSFVSLSFSIFAVAVLGRTHVQEFFNSYCHNSSSLVAIEFVNLWQIVFIVLHIACLHEPVYVLFILAKNQILLSYGIVVCKCYVVIPPVLCVFLFCYVTLQTSIYKLTN